MKLKFKFLHLDRSDSLIDFATERFERILKLELKPAEATIIFSSQRHTSISEINIMSPDLSFHSKGNADNFYEAFDLAFVRIERQMSKRKKKIQKHKSYEKSRRAHVDHYNSLNEEIVQLPLGNYKKSG